MEPATEMIGALRTPRSRAILVVAVWFVAMALGLASATRLHDVAVTDPGAFFPAGSPHRVARHEIERLFPGTSPLSQIALVVETDREIMSDRERLSALARRLRRLPSSAFVSAVLSPTDNPVLQRRLIASDSHAALILIQLAVGFASEDGARIVEEVENVLPGAESADFRIFLSGDATLGRDYDRAIDEGGKRSAWATLALVVVILLAVYRSPVAAGVSIFTLGAALGVTFGLVTLAASLGLPVAYQARSFLVAIVYGVGTDYCLLLFSRVREEYAAGSDGRVRVADPAGVADPVGVACRASFHVIVGSAVAVGVACGLMSFARFGLFRYSGAALAIGVMTALAATLTLAPALMRLLGPRLFWPLAPGAVRSRKLWPVVARLVLARPVVSLVVIAVLIAPLVRLGARARPTFENEIDIPSDSPSEAGYAALRRHFSLSAVGPLAVMVQVRRDTCVLPEGLRGPDGLAAIYQLTERFAATPGVGAVYSATRPTGEAGLLERGTIRSQLGEIEAGIRRARDGAHLLARGLGGAKGDVARGERDIEEKRASLEEDRRSSLAALLAARRFDAAARDLEEFHHKLEKLEAGLARAVEGSNALASGLDSGIDRLRLMRTSPGAAGALDRLAVSPEDLAAAPELARAIEHFVSSSESVTPSASVTPASGADAMGDAALFEVELTAAPNSPEAVRILRELNARLPIWFEAQGLPGARARIGGPTPITADLESITETDLRFVGGLVVGGIFLLLVVLLGGFAVPAAVTLYLLASYLAALGALYLCARAEIWPGVDWKAPFFLFVLLVAIGADYGVFLLGRAREEAARSSFREGLARAMEVTGPVVSSCGFVLAGTFAALALSRVAFLQQVGIGVTIGVLVDTLLVRPFMLPATAMLLHRNQPG
jgi:RND superfamily putative drug exporter